MKLSETSYETFKRLGILNEMAISLKEWQDKAEDLRFQIVENWCLCKWCQLFDTNNSLFNHWKVELRAFIRKLKLIHIKNDISKDKVLTRVWISKCDLNDKDMVLEIIEDKFNEKNLMDAKQKEIVAASFANEVDDLIECIAQSKITSDAYIMKTFAVNEIK